jgi:PAS domain S-box-containing protein
LPYGEARTVPIPKASRDISTATKATAFVEEALRWTRQDSAANPEPTEILRDIAAEPPSNDVPAGSRERILVADDNADMRDYVRRLLAPHYDVETVGNGTEALQAIRRTLPGLVLSDVMMPVCDGFSLLREIRADPALNGLPVILLSARTSDGAKVEGLNAGADDYLIKPFSAQELLARVNTNMTMARLRREIGAEVEVQKARLQAVLDTVPVAVWFTFDRDGLQVIGNRRAAEMLRMPETENASLSVPPPQAPQHFRVFRDGLEVPPHQMPLRRAVLGETIVNEEMELRFADGSVSAGLVQAAPLRDPSGKIVGAVSAGLDITDRKRIEDHRLLLLNELNHRVKNTLAMVQSISVQSFHRSKTIAAGRETFESRLLALSRAHDVLTNESWQGANLGEIVAQAIAPYRTGEPSRFQVSGPPVRLSAKMALSISMALHELATNAVKYGALSNEQGSVTIAWHSRRETKGSQLQLEWSEAGGPPVVAPRQKGFGTRLIERGLAQELGGRAKIEYRPHGVWCGIDARLDA